MEIKEEKTLDEMRSVLEDPKATSPQVIYWVLDKIGGRWENMTVIAPGLVGREYPKTFGHYHINPKVNEIYHVASGSGILIRQDEKEFRLLKLKAGDEIVIEGDYGHALINIGDEPLVTYDDRKMPHSPEDYEAVAKYHGLAYFLVDDGGNVQLIPNPAYEKLPEIKWE